MNRWQGCKGLVALSFVGLLVVSCAGPRAGKQPTATVAVAVTETKPSQPAPVAVAEAKPAVVDLSSHYNAKLSEA